jgi:aspartyl-tRNA(Asn)/glutamyl-tRNA(Gln) amidotransferase subunit A
LADDEPYGRINLLVLRNPTVINALVISIPCHASGEAPVGLILACRNGQDHHLLPIAKAIETLFPR